MSDKALENALAARDALAVKINNAQAEIDDWRRELSKIEEFVALWHGFAGMEAPLGRRDQPQPALGGASPLTDTQEPRPKNPRKEDVAEAALKIIAERGRPILRDELFELLAAQGVNIHGKDPHMVLSTMLWRMRGKVARIEGCGYWPADRDYRPAGYLALVGGDEEQEPPVSDDYAEGDDE